MAKGVFYPKGDPDKDPEEDRIKDLEIERRLQKELFGHKKRHPVSPLAKSSEPDEPLDLYDEQELCDAIDRLQNEGVGRAKLQQLFTSFAVKICLELSAEDRVILRKFLSRNSGSAFVPDRLKKIYSDLVNCKNLARDLGLVMYEV